MNMPSAFGDIMISYAWDLQEPTHQSWVKELDAKLRALGFSTTLDIRCLPALGAGNVNLWMERAIKNAKWVVAIVTHKYIQKCDDRDDGNNLGYEIDQIILKFVKTGRSNRIISVLRPGVHENPAFIPLALWIDFSNQTQYEQNFKELVQRLNESSTVSINPHSPPLQIGSSHTLAEKKHHKHLSEIPVHCWQPNRDRSEFLCLQDSNVRIKILRQTDWSVCESWAITSLGHGSYKVLVMFQQGARETTFDFATNVKGEYFLPFPEKDKGILRIGYMADLIAKVINHQTLGKHYETLKSSAGIKSS